MKKIIGFILFLILAFSALPSAAAVRFETLERAHQKQVSIIGGGTKSGELADLVDGDPETAWISDGRGWDCIVIDLQGYYYIESIKATVPEGLFPGYFTIAAMNTATGGMDTSDVFYSLSQSAAGTYDCPHPDTLPDIPYRYIKIQNMVGNSCGFTEIEVMGRGEILDLQEVAEAKPVKLNAGATLLGQPSAMVDGDRTTYWASQGTYTVLQIDLGIPYTLDNITVDVTQELLDLDSTVGSYWVGLSNTEGDASVEWGESRLHPPSGEYIHTVNTDTKYRYIKFYTYGAEAFGFVDVKAYSKDPYFKNWKAKKDNSEIASLQNGIDSVEIEIVDNRNTPGAFMLLAVLYDSGGNMICCRTAQTSGERGSSVLSVDVSDWQFAQGCSMRTVLIDNLQNMYMYNVSLLLSD